MQQKTKIEQAATEAAKTCQNVRIVTGAGGVEEITHDGPRKMTRPEIEQSIRNWEGERYQRYLRDDFKGMETADLHLAALRDALRALNSPSNTNRPSWKDSALNRT